MGDEEMSKASLCWVLPIVATLAGCQMETAEFGGSGGSFGGSGQPGVSLARDVCVNTARQQGLIVARVDSVSEYSFGNAPPRGVMVRMQVRRDPMSVNLEPRVCRFSYDSGEADISRT
jgi:hypothetical protein